jgi:hypothetical protein
LDAESVPRNLVGHVVADDIAVTSEVVVVTKRDHRVLTLAFADDGGAALAAVARFRDH